MNDDKPSSLVEPQRSTDRSGEPAVDLAQFADSYASFNRIVNGLQRKYIELKDEFASQQERLVKANEQLTDLSARNLAANEFLNGILSSMTAGVIAVDRHGIITGFNPAASIMLGIPQREPIGKHYRDIIPAGEPVEANALRASETGKPVDSVEKVLILADDTQLIVSVSTAILTDRQGRPTGAIEVFHDLTKTKKMEQEITRLNTLAALGEMAAAVAHQVRNPLSGILGYGSLLQRDMDADDPRQKLVSRITDGVETLNKTVTTLLDYTRHEEIKRDTVQFDQFLDDAIKLFRRDHDHLAVNLKFSVSGVSDPDPAERRVVIDPVLFRQVLFNLFCNSAQACETGVHVTVSFRKLPRQTAMGLYSERLLLGLDETVFEVVVTDDGPGVPEEALDSLFAPFFTTRDNGNGLGLAMAWKIMKGHGGDIALDRAYDRGARFVLLIPARIRPLK
jgi:PAS domain S-box-containing protein